MNNLLDEVRKYLPVIEKIEFLDNYYIIYSAGKKYYLKEVTYNISKLFEYFSKIEFSSYKLLLSNSRDSYLLYEIGEKEENDLGKELIYVLTDLQNKSCIYKKYEELEKKKIYDKIHLMIEERMKFYLNLHDIIDDFDFPPPQYYLLVKNISRFYKLLQNSFVMLDEWYEKSEDEYREVFLIKDVSFDNFFKENNLSFFLDYGIGERGILIYDFLSFYKNECFVTDMNNLFDLYREKLLLKDYEVSLLLCLICIPDEILFTDNSFVDTVMVRKVVDYVYKVDDFLLKENKKNKETDKDKFKEENDDINFSSNKN